MAQAAEMVRLRRGPGKIRPPEYYDLRLFDDARYSRAAKLEFIGNKRNREIDRLLNHPQWRGFADSKIALMALLQGLGFPTPTTHAVYRPDGRSAPRIRFLRDPAALAEFLRAELPYPAFAKPVRSRQGEGAVRITSYDAETDRLVLAPGAAGPLISDFVEQIHRFPHSRTYGYLFQEPTRQHPEIERISGTAVSTVRMVVALQQGGPRLVRAVFRIARLNAVTDNLVHGTSGSLAGAIDVDTGLVVRVISGRGLDEAEIDVHPDSGARLRGIRIPRWSTCVSVVCDAATFLPGLQLQHWDVAIGPDDPILIEVNYAGGVGVSQSVFRRGVLTEDFRSYVERYGSGFRV